MNYIKENKKLVLIILVTFFIGFACGSSGSSTTTTPTTTSETVNKTDTIENIEESKEVVRTEIELMPNEIITISKEQEGKYIIQELQTDDMSWAAILTKNGESTYGSSITLEEGDQLMVTNCSATTPVRKLVPTK